MSNVITTYTGKKRLYFSFNFYRKMKVGHPWKSTET